MFNLIKMDLYRLFRSTSTYVMVILAASVAVFTIYMTYYELNMVKEGLLSSMENADTESDTITLGIHVDTDLQWIDGDIDYSEMLGTQLQSGLLLILVSVFVTLFVAAEIRNGFVKNIAGQFRNRGIMVTAKLVALAVQVLILLVTFALFILFSSLIFWGNRIVLTSIVELLQLAGLQYLLHFAFACLITFLCLLSHSPALSMTVGILLCSGLGGLIYGLIDRITGDSFHIEDYMLEVNISSVGAGIPSDAAVHAVLIGIGYILVTMVLSMLAVQKRDIK